MAKLREELALLTKVSFVRIYGLKREGDELFKMDFHKL